AEAFLAELKGGAAWDDLVTREHLEVEETGWFNREGAYIRNLGNAKELKQAAFTLSADSPYPDQVFEIGTKFIVVRFKEKKPFDPKAFEAEKESLRAQLLSEKQNEVLQAWLEQKKSESKIVWNLDPKRLR
ncbi:MAG: hypothetical protein D6812_17420, partial [Deltaproteobacteria bacterium]